MPSSSYAEAEKVVAEQRTTISEFVSKAVERYIHDLKLQKLEQELKEGYVANAALGKQINDEFTFVDAEIA